MKHLLPLLLFLPLGCDSAQRDMTPDRFWAIIDKTRVGDPPSGRQAEALRQALEPLTPQELEQFDHEFARKLISAYRWDLWGAASLVKGGCSDDGFVYFRCWLISQGREFYEAALKNPEHILTRASFGDPEEFECEQLWHVAGDVYQTKTGGQLIAGENYPLAPDGPAGNPWKEEDLEGLFPKLWERYRKK